MRGLTLTHLQFDEQWTYVAKKQARLTTTERQKLLRHRRHLPLDVRRPENQVDAGFLIGKRSADNARRFMMDVAGRLVFPTAHASDPHAYQPGGYTPVVQISTDGFPAYPEAVDLAFGPYAKYGTIIKDYRNAT